MVTGRKENRGTHRGGQEREREFHAESRGKERGSSRFVSYTMKKMENVQVEERTQKRGRREENVEKRMAVGGMGVCALLW